MTKEDNKRLDFNEKVQLVVKKEELKEQDIRLNKLCFGYQEKDKKIAKLEAQIEKMKCCENCMHYDSNEPKYCNKGILNAYVCDKWEFGN